MIAAGSIKYIDSLLAKYALRDYQQANPKPRLYVNGKSNYKPYSISNDASEALDMLRLARKENLSIEEEETVKAYILRHKLLQNT